MTMRTLTFEGLARADRATLEEILVGSTALDPEILDGRTYDGYNHDWLGQLANKKFRKVFVKKDDMVYGFNQMTEQDKDEYRGEWRPLLAAGGKPIERGFFRVMYVREIPQQMKFSMPYRHLTYFDYNVDLNSRRDVFVRMIRDFVGLPNAEDYSLVLGKAYLRFASWFNLFASYFVLKENIRPS